MEGQLVRELSGADAAALRTRKQRQAPGDLFEAIPSFEKFDRAEP